MAALALEQTNEELLLGFLADGGDDYIAGEALCGKLGLSRTELWKHLEALRSKGYRIEASSAHGYRLLEIPDRLSPLELSPLLSTHDLGRVIHYAQEVGSTNEVAKRLAEEGALHGEVVVAEAQTQGRGRQGRVWISPAGKNLYCSFVLRPDLPAQRAPELTLVAALGVVEALEDAGVHARIKWPNDILVGDRKIAGILSELSTQQDRIAFVILGLGVNLNAGPLDFPAELKPVVTSLSEARGHLVPRALFAAALFRRLEEWLDRHAEEGFEVARDAWRSYSDTLGQHVLVRTGVGEFQGVAEDIDELGALWVRTADGERVRVTAAELHRLKGKMRE